MLWTAGRPLHPVALAQQAEEFLHIGDARVGHAAHRHDLPEQDAERPPAGGIRGVTGQIQLVRYSYSLQTDTARDTPSTADTAPAWLLYHRVTESPSRAIGRSRRAREAPIPKEVSAAS